MAFTGGRVSVATPFPLGWVVKSAQGCVLLGRFGGRAGVCPLPQPRPHSESVQRRGNPHGHCTPQKMLTITDPGDTDANHKPIFTAGLQ